MVLKSTKLSHFLLNISDKTFSLKLKNIKEELNQTYSISAINTL